MQTFSGQAKEACDTAHRLLRLLPADDSVRRAAAVHLCARMERQLGRVHEARALVLDELRGITDRQTPEAVLLRIRLVADRVQRADIRGAQAVLDMIPESLPEWGPGLRAGVASMRPMAAYVGGRMADAIRYTETADHLFSAASDNDFADCLDCVLWLVWAEIFLGRYEDALRHVDRLVAISRATGQSYILGYMLAARARVYALQGRFKEASASADEASAVGRLLRAAEVTAYGLTQQSLIASARGDHDQALRFADEAVANDTGSSEWWARMTHVARAFAIIHASRLKEGSEALIEACGDGTNGLDLSTLVICAETLAWVGSAQNQPDEAGKWADIAEALALPEFGGDIGLARLARAHASRATEPAQAATFAVEAAELLRKAGRLPDAARAELTAGLAYGAAGLRAPGRERLRAAAEIFESCGMEAMHAQTVREQRRLGVRVPVGRRGGGSGGKEELPFGLSPREYEIATLVVEGCSNQQIAERLYLSVRTVETHLSRVFSKVGVSSRVGVATAMNRQS
ncbi:LuxR C-terminal-related transcriptional regulator [Actinomadura sp. 6N118]|uniref:helix-turn-helix transcriptional regulator n=1 Tax=Actinomadura sp. 6N118 TaxID=3375151 RepID=UPI003788F5E2